jgi:hypothetical protein
MEEHLPCLPNSFFFLLFIFFIIFITPQPSSLLSSPSTLPLKLLLPNGDLSLLAYNNPKIYFTLRKGAAGSLMTLFHHYNN